MSRLGLPLLLVLCCAMEQPSAQETPVTPKEIQDTWIGRELLGSAASGAPVVMRLEADGSASLTAGSTADKGTWRLSETGYCTTWKVIRAGQERCYTVLRSGSSLRVLNPDGTLSGQFASIR
jgi:hypothetical protein